MIQCKMMCRKHMFLMTTIVQKAASRGPYVPGGVVELGGPTTSRALSILIGLSQWFGMTPISFTD